MIEATVTNAQPLVLRLQDKGNTSLRQMLVEPVAGNVELTNRMGFNRQLSAAVAALVQSRPQRGISNLSYSTRSTPTTASVSSCAAVRTTR